MTSIIVYLALFLGISLGYALFQYKNGIGALGRWYIAVIIIMTRVLPIMMMEDKNIDVFYIESHNGGKFSGGKYISYYGKRDCKRIYAFQYFQ